MNYLIYIEHSAENLQFFLWYRDYSKRFPEAETTDLALAPEWTQAMEDECVARLQKEGAEKIRREPAAASIFKGTDFEKNADATIGRGDPFSTPPRTPMSHDDSFSSTGPSGMGRTNYRSQAREAFAAAGVKQPCTYPRRPGPVAGA